MTALAKFSKFQDLPLLQAIQDGQGLLKSTEISGLDMSWDSVPHLSHSQLKCLTIGPVHAQPLMWQSSQFERLIFAEGGTYQIHADACSFASCTGVNISFYKSTFTSSSLLHTDFRSSSFELCLFMNITFETCDLGWAHIKNSTFQSEVLRPFAISVSSSKFSDCVFMGYDFSAVESFDLAQFERCQFIQCSFTSSQKHQLFNQGNLVVTHTSIVKTDAPPVAVVKKTENLSKQDNSVQIKAEPAAKVSVKPEKLSRFSSIEAMD